jgi:hypothetical protein
MSAARGATGESQSSHLLCTEDLHVIRAGTAVDVRVCGIAASPAAPAITPQSVAATMQANRVVGLNP